MRCTGPADGGQSPKERLLGLRQQADPCGRYLNPLHLFQHTKHRARLPNEKPLKHLGKATTLEGVAAGAGAVSHVMLRIEFAKPAIIASVATLLRAVP